jgi:arylsulfatase A-like enzyme
VLLGVLAAAGGIALFLFFVAPKIFRGGLGKLAQPLGAAGALVVTMILGGVSMVAFGPGSGGERFHGGVPAKLTDRPNVLLIMVDTLRADHLSCYGAEIQTPNMCSLLDRRGSLFQGFANASWTKPSTASLLTGLLPSTHNVMSKPASLSPEIDMLSEVLKESGYTTGGIVSNPNLTSSFGFEQGYDEYYFMGPDYLFGAEESASKLIIYNIVRAVWFKLNKGLRFGDFYQDSVVMNSKATEWFDAHQADRFFLFLHYMDVHDPYFEHPYNGYGIARVSNQNPDASQAEEMHRLYNGEIAYLDENIGHLFDHMKKQGIYDDTMIVLVSDHGEEFQEHGGWWHGLTLYEEQIHVPFLIKWPKGSATPAASSTDELARLIDVAPTVIAATGLEIPPAMQGIDLMSDGANRSPKDREVYSEEDHEGNVLWSLRTKEMKLIVANEDNPHGLPARALFDVNADPGETKNLSDGSHKQQEDMLAEHADLQLRAAQGEAIASSGDGEMSREQCEQLMNLGYVEDCNHLK